MILVSIHDYLSVWVSVLLVTMSAVPCCSGAELSRCGHHFSCRLLNWDISLSYPFLFLTWLCCGECRNIWNMHVCLCWTFQGTEQLSTNGLTEDDFGEPLVSHPWVPLASGAHICKSQLNKEIIWDLFALFFKTVLFKIVPWKYGHDCIDHRVPEVGWLAEWIT